MYQVSPEMSKVYGSILLSHRNKVLLVLGRNSGKWSFPKGHAYSDETPTECARRETYEETGLLPSLFCRKSLRLSKGTYFLYDIGTESVPRPRDTREIQEAKWIDVEDIPRYSCNVDVNSYYRNFSHRIVPRTQRTGAFLSSRKPAPVLPCNLLF